MSIMDRKTSWKQVAVLVWMMVVAMGCTKPEGPGAGVDHGSQNDSVWDASGSLDGHGFVDLGLPSGTLWATCNLGADTPEGFGDYFAWGETCPKERYDWKSYQYGSYIDLRYELYKYCADSCCGLNGFVDSLTVLEPMDDAATANWGAGWRMPTRKDWMELCQETTCVWTVQEGVKGRLVTGPNGNSIFLPAAGFRLDDGQEGIDLGIYWSSTLQTSCQVAAWSFHYDIDGYHVCGTYERNRGQAVRAVRSASPIGL